MGFFMLIMCGTHAEELYHISSPCMYMKYWTFFKAVVNLIICTCKIYDNVSRKGTSLLSRLISTPLNQSLKAGTLQL